MRFLLLLAALATPAAYADCTLLKDATTGRVLVEEGQCDIRMPPMSTFKIAIALMGFDSGVLQDEHHPVWPYKPGYADWRPEWKQDTDPARWMQLSVVWYSQQTTQRIGMDAFRRYVDKFDYGNRDLSGKDALTQAWLNSTLKISAREQVDFLQRVLKMGVDTGVSGPAVFTRTESILAAGRLAKGWHVYGKTGSGPTLGWYVGWLRKGQQTILFARQVIEPKDLPGPAGLRARDDFLQRLPSLLP